MWCHICAGCPDAVPTHKLLFTFAKCLTLLYLLWLVGGSSYCSDTVATYNFLFDITSSCGHPCLQVFLLSMTLNVSCRKNLSKLFSCISKFCSALKFNLGVKVIVIYRDYWSVELSISFFQKLTVLDVDKFLDRLTKVTKEDDQVKSIWVLASSKNF